MADKKAYKVLPLFPLAMAGQLAQTSVLSIMSTIDQYRYRAGQSLKCLASTIITCPVAAIIMEVANYISPSKKPQTVFNILHTVLVRTVLTRFIMKKKENHRI